MGTSHTPQRDEAWEGVVEDKSRGMLDGANMYHFVVVRRTDGESMRIRVERRLWKAVAVGDRLVKAAGSDPVKG
ncbi:hypothetical protein [Streptomyces sp. NPDC046939]|uniref:DUF7489 domain-containing protein n=1 Tax=Streptomyces sp. NPDC046939 TaxID=3155376 RepID=UPI0033CD974C